MKEGDDVKYAPDCLNKLANDPDYTRPKAQLKAQMERALNAPDGSRRVGQGEVFDKYESANSERRQVFRTLPARRKPQSKLAE